jgi:hypothetical protein
VAVLRLAKAAPGWRYLQKSALFVADLEFIGSTPGARITGGKCWDFDGKNSVAAVA